MYQTVRRNISTKRGNKVMANTLLRKYSADIVTDHIKLITGLDKQNVLA